METDQAKPARKSGQFGAVPSVPSGVALLAFGLVTGFLLGAQPPMMVWSLAGFSGSGALTALANEKPAQRVSLQRGAWVILAATVAFAVFALAV